MTLSETAELLRSMPAGYTQTYLQRKVDELCTLARLEGYIITIDAVVQPLNTKTEMVPNVRRARGHY